jgi:galactokinase
LAVGLALSEEVLKDRGAYRVHGGGFAGTIQAFVPDDLLEAYISLMESVFGNGCSYVLKIREAGGVMIR